MDVTSSEDAAGSGESSGMKMFIRSIGLTIIHRVGMKIRDARTGRFLGRALVIPWGGKLHVIGLSKAVRVSFLPQQRLTYWKQEIGFTVRAAPDFPHLDQKETGAYESLDHEDYL